MDSRYMKFFLFVTLYTTVAATQVSKEAYVNVNAQADIGGFASAAEDVVKTIGTGASHAANVAATAVKSIEVPAPAVQSSFYFEKNIQPLPAHSVVIEKEVEHKPIVATTAVPVVVHEAPQEVYVRKVYTHRRPAHHRRKYVYVNANAEVAPPTPRVNLFSKLLTVNTAPAPPPVVVEKEVHKQVVVPQHVQPASTVQHNTQYTATATVNKNGQLINDIFNIPVQTLRAVNTLVGNIVGGVSVSKQVNTQVHTGDAYPHNNANTYVRAEGHVSH